MRRWLDQKLAANRGFTIVELVVVIAVIAVLAVIVVVGYGAVVNNAHDSSVKSDLQKIDDAFKLFALDSGGTFPDSVAELSTLGIKLSKDSYFTDNVANVYLCYNAAGTEYAVIAMSRSQKRFVVKSESGISEYTGSVVWDSVTANWVTTCSSIDSGYVPAAGNVTGMVSSSWMAWTGAVPSITNLSVNPNASSNLNGWEMYYGAAGSGTSSRPTSGGQTEAHGRMTWTVSPSSVNSYLTQTSAVPNAGGRTFSVSGYVRVSWSGASFSLNAVPYNGADAYVGGEVYGSTIAIPANTWTRLSTTITPPAGTEYIDIRLRAMSGTIPTVGSTLDGDSFMLTEGNTLYQYMDGNSQGWAWNGTANNSTSTGPEL